MSKASPKAPAHDPRRVHFLVDGEAVEGVAGMNLAAWLLNAGRGFRADIAGQPRAALCGMGICAECRVVIDERPGVRACRTHLSEGLRVETGPAGGGPA